jgi:hypothetical protein
MTDLSIPLDREPRFVAPIGFEPAFEVRLDFEPVRREQTPHGERRMRKIIGGSITGKIAGSVYPNGGGDYLLGRSDGVTDLHTHIVLRDDRGEWLYIRNIGYARTDGYQRDELGRCRCTQRSQLGAGPVLRWRDRTVGEDPVLIRYAEVL